MIEKLIIKVCLRPSVSIHKENELSALRCTYSQNLASIKYFPYLDHLQISWPCNTNARVERIIPSILLSETNNCQILFPSHIYNQCVECEREESQENKYMNTELWLKRMFFATASKRGVSASCSAKVIHINEINFGNIKEYHFLREQEHSFHISSPINYFYCVPYRSRPRRDVPALFVSSLIILLR